MTAEQLFERIKPEFDAVDVDNLSTEVREVLWMAQTVDVPTASEDYKRLVTLLENEVITHDNEVITHDEVRVLILYLAKLRHAA